MVCVDYKNPPNLLVVSENGYGKRSELEDYRVTKRGGKGVKTLNVTEKTGELVAIKDVVDGDELMIINKSGIAIRMSVDALRVMGRATQGVRLIRLNDEDMISAVEKISNLGVEDEVENEGETGEDTSSSDENKDQENEKDSE